MRDEQPVSDLLKVVFRRLEMTDAVNDFEVKDAYRSIVGDLINKLTWSLRYENRVLYVKVASAALRQELSYKKYDLTKRINDQLGRNALDNVIFV